MSICSSSCVLYSAVSGVSRVHVVVIKWSCSSSRSPNKDTRFKIIIIVCFSPT